MKSPKQPTKEHLEFEPNAWQRFERAVDVVAKSPDAASGGKEGEESAKRKSVLHQAKAASLARHDEEMARVWIFPTCRIAPQNLNFIAIWRSQVIMNQWTNF
jgi:hypothetical protein